MFTPRVCLVFFFKQKTAYEMRISDWSSDVCSSDLPGQAGYRLAGAPPGRTQAHRRGRLARQARGVDLMKPDPEKRGLMNHTMTRTRSRAVRAAGVLLCVFALAGCSTIKGWFDGKDKDKSAEPSAIGRAAGRKRGGQYGENSVGAESLK